ncbi:MAG: Rpn family recombination-promoting nuclease/putative transposase [Saprospiraceae bacterium]
MGVASALLSEEQKPAYVADIKADYAKIAEAHLRDALDAELLASLDLATLRLADDSYLASGLEEFFSDVVWRCNLLAGPEVAVCFLFEHKSHPPDWPIHVQLLQYKLGIWRDDLSEGRPLTLVVPIVVYHGRRKWKREPFWAQFRGTPEGFRHFLAEFDYVLTDLREMPTEIIIAKEQLGAVRGLFLAFKHAFDEAQMLRHFREMIIFVEGSGLHEEMYRRLFEMIFTYVFRRTTEPAVLAAELKTFSSKTRDIAMSAYDKLIAQGRQEGWQKGVQEGIEKGIEKSAREFAGKLILETDFGDASIANFSGLPEAEVRKMRAEMRPTVAKPRASRTGKTPARKPRQPKK